MLFSICENTYAKELEVFQGKTLPVEFNADVTLKEIESEIEVYIGKQALEIVVGDDKYTEFMHDILMNEVNDIDETTLRYFQAYASVFLVEKQIQVENLSLTMPTRTEIDNDILDKSIASIKQENQEENATTSIRSKSSRNLVFDGNYNVERAQRYADMYAELWNPGFVKYTKDCTNFASQIVHYAGMPMVKDEWSNSGKAGYYGHTWTVAQDFTEYWSLIRGYLGTENSTITSVISQAEPGDFLAYKNSDTYAIWHMAFVHTKGNNTIYISQHTTNLKNVDWKTRVDNNWMNNNYVIIVDFTK